MRSSGLTSFLLVLVLGTGGGIAEAQQDSYPAFNQWITRELETRNYRLSSYERDGLSYCSTGDQKIIETQFENGYVLIILEREAPVFFLQEEISGELLGKLKNVELGQRYNILCVHSFFRDDWQQRYDEAGEVNHRLLNAMRARQEDKLLKIP